MHQLRLALVAIALVAIAGVGWLVTRDSGRADGVCDALAALDATPAGPDMLLALDDLYYEAVRHDDDDIREAVNKVESGDDSLVLSGFAEINRATEAC